ncbi:MAG: hypothetical protein KGJ66_10740 [Alphaproteobacteria bacterium]|nr:hypothetical protein [Alphaproteobacteria bacterium]
MPKPSRLFLAKDDIVSLFSKAPQKVYSEARLAGLLLENRALWRLPHHTTTTDLIRFLAKQGGLQAHKFRSEAYQREIIRYSWGQASPLELAISIKSRAYFCHATAVIAHGLAKLGDKTIYLNAEQSPKWFDPAPPTQDAIDRAFSGNQRQSKLIYKYRGMSVVMISGKNTNRLGVEEISGPASEKIPVTNLERTLIDIAVRPAYAGGASQVLRAYRAAKDRVSVQRLLAILAKLDYVYPYHQSIGFLMQRAGYPQRDYAPLRKLGLDLNFYLAYAMDQRDYCEEWRLFYPKGLRALSLRG